MLWQKSPEKEDAVRYAEAYLRRGQMRSLLHPNIQQTPAMNDFGQARDLFAVLLPQDPGMAAFVLETAHSSCLEIAKSIPRGFWAFMACGQVRLAKQTAEAALASVVGLALNDEARAWEGKLKVFLK